jgi:acyl-coenzyme A synthetase/AMP-(fatty) acid ligase
VLFGRLDELSEVVIVPGPDGGAVPVVCTKENRPLDLSAWRVATADLPAMANPIQWRIEDLPHTATGKIKRLELAARLAVQPGDA